MRAIRRLLIGIVGDERGGETVEYALIVGLIIAAAMAVFTAVGSRVFGR